jgi:hypothetical protein
MATSLASCEVIWLRKLLAGLFGQVLEPMVIYCDNRSSVKVSKYPLFHDRLKHIEIRYHFIRDMVQKGAIKLQYNPTDEQIVDILTKPLVKGKFVYFRDKLGVLENSSLAKSVNVFVALGSYSHIGLVVGHVGIFVGTHIALLFCENPFYVELGLGIVIVGAWHPLGGINNSNLMLSLEGVPKLTLRIL